MGTVTQVSSHLILSFIPFSRAKIFDRDHGIVKDIDGLTKLMRYNNYQKDEFSKCKCNPPYTAEAAISARGDLNPVNGTYEFPGMGHVNHGALDYKGTNVEMMKNLAFKAQGGPTWGDVPAFKWSTFDFVRGHLLLVNSNFRTPK